MAEKGMQQTAGSDQMAAQQPKQTPAVVPLHQLVYLVISRDLQTTQSTLNSMAWQLGTSANERMGLTMDLISNISLACEDIDHMRVAELGWNLERDMFHKSPSKEVYEQAITSKIVELWKEREENESSKIQSAGGKPSANSTS
ncbi:hypothetical protein E4U58_003655 [Claviceps cyperi]|nr:hypothetical protein E4U58_003655 [Claviceps cyperi]